MVKLRYLLTASLSIAAFAQPLRLTDIQIVGSHNSYHSGLAPSDAARLRRENPKVFESLDYQHPPIEQQLSSGVRQIEIDVFGDSKGGLFANPAGPRLTAKQHMPPDPPFDPAGIMTKPGFKVLHVQDLDYRSNCQPFTNCLTVVREWSKAHPGHLPIFILIENKDSTPRPEYMVQPEKLTAATFNALDAEIRSVFAPNELITPDDVRGAHTTLEHAVLTDGWPTLDKARGKVIFLLDQERVTPIYTAGHRSLEGRVMFTNSKLGTPDAAFVKMNDPANPQVPELIRKGYLVRTMTDTRDGSTKRRDAALASGAQLLSTDYPFDHKMPKSNFSVSFGSGNARCNPVLQPKLCSAEALREK